MFLKTISKGIGQTGDKRWLIWKKKLKVGAKSQKKKNGHIGQPWQQHDQSPCAAWWKRQHAFHARSHTGNMCVKRSNGSGSLTRAWTTEINFPSRLDRTTRVSPIEQFKSVPLVGAIKRPSLLYMSLYEQFRSKMKSYLNLSTWAPQTLAAKTTGEEEERRLKSEPVTGGKLVPSCRNTKMLWWTRNPFLFLLFLGSRPSNMFFQLKVAEGKPWPWGRSGRAWWSHHTEKPELPVSFDFFSFSTNIRRLTMNWAGFLPE